MLFARTMSRLARQLFSDVIGIGYVEGEICDSRTNIEVLEVLPESDDKPHDQDLLVVELYDHFSVEDQDILKEFIEAVSSHYKWTYYTTVRNLLKDIPELSRKFINWKTKRSNA